jgi:tetratricopeptide (TPR) repeat protein
LRKSSWIAASTRPPWCLKRAYDDSGGTGGFLYFSLEISSRIYGRLGQKAEMERADAELTKRRKDLPSERLQRLAQFAHDGMQARDRHDAAAALRDLKQAEAMVRPGESNTDLHFELGSAYLEGGQDAQAAPYFERIVNSGTLRANDPLQFVRSLYFLGQINERKGDRAKAAEYYRRFVQYWGEGDMDRDRVADARKKAG